ncbi:hypothetical protein [Serratia marcescens]|uniref:hypothetical protein n=1 Tax=Serratia marcescens TaxID=615 RepID=UPI001D47084D|nr:hypothetical protein [Serratia marcescens]
MTRPTTAQLNAAYDQFNFWYDKAKKLDEELAKAEKRIAELEAKTAMTMGVGSGNGNLFVHGDYDSIKAAQVIVLENESLRAKLATPVRLTEERTLWAGEDDYDTGHVKGWNANRIEQAALLKKQGFTVEGDS